MREAKKPKERGEERGGKRGQGEWEGQAKREKYTDREDGEREKVVI